MSEPRIQPSASTGARASSGDEDVVDLVAKLTCQGAHLAQEQVSLMQAEVRQATADAKAAAGAMVGAAVVGIAGLGVLLMGISYLVGVAIENIALGTVIVGAATLIIAGIMYAGARKKMSATTLTPTRTIETAEDTPAVLTGHMHRNGAHHAR
ncbi:MAG: hypothetical protein B7X57_07570 [Erythrobacter sp. 34-65-8]|nr:MAG: hypothetical protein B7X57_07570 [Erythrobacter sp. 34-65-8]